MELVRGKARAELVGAWPYSGPIRSARIPGRRMDGFVKTTSMLDKLVYPILGLNHERALGFFALNLSNERVATVRAVYTVENVTWFLLENVKGELQDWPAGVLTTRVEHSQK